MDFVAIKKIVDIEKQAKCSFYLLTTTELILRPNCSLLYEQLEKNLNKKL